MLKRSLALAAVLCLAAGCKSQTTEQLGGMPSPTLSGQDNRFFRQVTEGNLTEIQSSNLALQSASSQPVKVFAQTMITDHTSAATSVSALAQTKGVKLPTMLDEKHKDLLDTLNGKSGTDFDKAYIDLQVKAHQETINDATDEANNGNDPEVKSLAVSLTPVLRQHLEMALKLQNGM